jgi:hypothetical protein
MATDPNAFTVDALLCDSAAVAEGKLYIQGGGWNMLTATMFPLIQSRIGLAAMVGVPWSATNRNHRLEVNLLGEDGPLPLAGEESDPADPTKTRRAVAIGGQFNIGRPPTLEAGDRQNMPFAINFDGLQFPSPGSYSFTLSIDDVEINRLSFRVVGPPGIMIQSSDAA